MVELQIVILAVAGSSPVGHPTPAECGARGGIPAANYAGVINPPLPLPSSNSTSAAFWQHILNDDTLRDCDDLEKLVTGCELIAMLDDLDLLAA